MKKTSKILFAFFSSFLLLSSSLISCQGTDEIIGTEKKDSSSGSSSSGTSSSGGSSSGTSSSGGSSSKTEELPVLTKAAKPLVTLTDTEGTLYSSLSANLALSSNSAQGYASSNLRQSKTESLSVKYLNDGNTSGTYYIIANTSDGDTNPWFAVDLKEVKEINRVTLIPGADSYSNAYPVEYQIQAVKSNASVSSASEVPSLEWETLATVSGGLASNLIVTFPAVSARWVRILVQSYADYCSLYELEVYAPDKEILLENEVKTTEMLFIGNSMTYYNTLAKVFEGIALRKGKDISCTAATNGGRNLIFQSNADNIKNAILSDDWDVVVLQDIVGSFNKENLATGAARCVSEILSVCPASQILFYEPWPVKGELTGTSSKLPYFTSSYITTAKKHSAILAPAGEAFYDIYVNSSLDYYCSDNKHPQPLGTFISASTIYYALYAEDEYSDWTSDDQDYLDSLINNNVAYSDGQGKEDSYSLETLNLINKKGFEYARAVAPAVSDSTGTIVYTSAAE